IACLSVAFYVHHRYRLSVPTRRSSDLLVLVTGVAGIGKSVLVERFAAEVERAGAKTAKGWTWESGGAPALWPWIEAVRSVLAWRSEEHTSELQSREKLVCRLLLEKKKK